jgi:hypothetical protein
VLVLPAGTTSPPTAAGTQHGGGEGDGVARPAVPVVVIVPRSPLDATADAAWRR